RWRSRPATRRRWPRSVARGSSVVDLCGTLKGSRAPPDEPGAAYPRFARRDSFYPMQRRVIAVLAVGAVAVAAVAVAMASLQQDLAAYWVAGEARSPGAAPAR